MGQWSRRPGLSKAVPTFPVCPASSAASSSPSSTSAASTSGARPSTGTLGWPLSSIFVIIFDVDPPLLLSSSSPPRPAPTTLLSLLARERDDSPTSPRGEIIDAAHPRYCPPSRTYEQATLSHQTLVIGRSSSIARPRSLVLDRSSFARSAKLCRDPHFQMYSLLSSHTQSAQPARI
jgi:hypothetical protein